MPPARRQLRIAALAGSVLFLALAAWLGLPFLTTNDPPFPTPSVPAVTSRDNGRKAEDILAKLKPGMLRADVEAILGPATSVDSIRNGNDRLSYRATFARESTHPPLPPLELEFDATRPGHPLILAKPM